jgi:hypothetical protein
MPRNLDLALLCNDYPALVEHKGDFADARIPQAAREFTQPPLVANGGRSTIE